MKDEFEFPIYVAYKLANVRGCKCVDKKKSIPGFLKRKDGITTLQIDDIPLKEGTGPQKHSILQEEYINNYEDDHEWYGVTWDSKLLFRFNKYYFTNRTNSTRNDYINWGGVSTWLVTDFEILNLFTNMDEVLQMSLSIDDIYEYFGFHVSENELKKCQFIEFKSLKYQDLNFTLKVGEVKNSQYGNRQIIKTCDARVVFEFSQKIDKDTAFEIAILTRDLFQILTDEKVGLNQIILGKKVTRKKPSPRVIDHRKNWIVSQKFMSKIKKPKIYYGNLETDYRKLQGNFNEILENYFGNRSLQALIRTFLITAQVKIPINTVLITLASGIESYLKNATYPSNGKKIKNFKDKLKKVVDIVGFNYNLCDKEFFLDKIKDSRDYFIHGDKAEKFISEIDLITYVDEFSKIYFRYIIHEIKNLE